MDYNPDQSLGLQPPKLCCIPARPLVCGFAALGVARGIIAIVIDKGDWMGRVPQIIFIFLNFLLLFGAARNNEPALKWSQRVMMLAVILAGLQFLIWPVMYSSFTASGMADNDTMMQYEDELFGDVEDKKKRFVRGMITGYVFEIGTALLIGVEILKYVLVHRLWMYAKSTENIGGNQYIVP